MRRKVLQSLGALSIGTAGCLSTFTQTRSIPLNIANKSDTQCKISVTVLSDSSGEQIFSERIELNSGESTQFTIKKLDKDVVYTLTATMEDGSKAETLINSPTITAEVEISENGELRVYRAVS